MFVGCSLEYLVLAAGSAALAAAVSLYIIFGLLAAQYTRVTFGNSIDIDSYVGDKKPSTKARAKVALLHQINVGSRIPSKTMIPLAHKQSDFVAGLQVTSRSGSVPGSQPFAPSEGAIVVGTIRMGFGHHRIAYAAASWGLASPYATYFHDLLNIDSPEATAIRETDQLYSKGSRLATEIGGPVERLWGALPPRACVVAPPLAVLCGLSPPLLPQGCAPPHVPGSFTKSGDENALRVTYQMAETLRPLLLGLPRDTPIVATHSLVGLIAVACGFTNVINLVIDNHAQWFIIVPGALNLVQGPSKSVRPE